MTGNTDLTAKSIFMICWKSHSSHLLNYMGFSATQLTCCVVHSLNGAYTILVKSKYPKLHLSTLCS